MGRVKEVLAKKPVSDAGSSPLQKLLTQEGVANSQVVNYQNALEKLAKKYKDYAEYVKATDPLMKKMEKAAIKLGKIKTQIIMEKMKARGVELTK